MAIIAIKMVMAIPIGFAIGFAVTKVTWMSLTKRSRR